MKELLADDHRLLLEGLNNLLSSQGIEVVGMARNGREALEMARALQPDVILMDIRMPEWDGLEATRRIMAEMPAARIVMLTTSAEEQDLFEAVKSGAYGYLLKSIDSDELVEALGQSQEGIPPFSPILAGKLLREFARLAGPDRPDAALKFSGTPVAANHLPDSFKISQTSQGKPEEDQSLTAREREVLILVAQGLSYKEIGARLNLSPRTVKYHMAEIIARLHLENRAQVLAYAGRTGLAGSDAVKN